MQLALNKQCKYRTNQQLFCKTLEKLILTWKSSLQKLNHNHKCFYRKNQYCIVLYIQFPVVLRDVRYTDIPKIPVLKLISVYRYDFFSHTDIPKFPVYREISGIPKNFGISVLPKFIDIIEIYRYTGVILTIAYCRWHLNVFRW